MKNIGGFVKIAVIVTLLAGISLPRQQAAAAGTVGDGTPASCTQTALHTALTGGGAVIFNCGVAPVSILISSPEAITLNTSINGVGLVTLNGNLTSQIFNITASGSLTLTNITLARGSAAQGGAISNSGTLAITNTAFNNNRAASGQGGAIYNSGTLNLNNTNFTGNTAVSGGGAIFSSGSLTVTGGEFNSNQVSNGLGGGVYSTGALTISAASFNINFASHVNAASGGGGLYTAGPNAAISASLFFANTGNPRGGGIYVGSGGSLTLTTSILDSNFSLTAEGGGGIYNQGTLGLSQDLIESNNASLQGFGSGIQNDASGTLTITNSTLALNFAGLGGSAIHNIAGTVSVTNSTISSNAGIALDNASSSLSLANSIVSGNTTNCRGVITSLGHNLDSANTCSFSAAGDLHDTDPMLGPLAANGGPTETFALLPGSPAINAADNAACPPTDQRGVHRPPSACDVGAFEFTLLQFLPTLSK